MSDAQSRVTVTFIGADASLSATAGAINTQLGSIAASATTLTGRLGELTAASQTYTAGLKTSIGSTSELERANDRLAKQDLTLLFRQQAKEAQTLASAQKQAEAEAQKLAAAQQKLAQSQAKEQLKAEEAILKALAQAERDAAREAEKLFQTNARLSQQRVTETLKAEADATKKLAQAQGEAEKSGGALSNILTGLGQGAGIAAFGALSNVATQLPSQILSVNLEFEKLRTVLTTLYGDAGKADVAFGKLQNFAATTPFQLNEVVESFIKLKNRGIDPTNDVLTRLGDLASSQGKSLDQVTEAVLDAQTGEFERLKEFGINTKTVGDQVSLTFKGVTQTVAKTPEALTGAILKLGELKGVAGGMEAQSKTLGGALSNLQDNAGAIAVEFGSQLIPALNELVKGLNDSGPELKDLARSLGENVAQGLQATIALTKQLSDRTTVLGSVAGATTDGFEGLGQTLGALRDATVNLGSTLNAISQAVGLGTTGVKTLADAALQAIAPVLGLGKALDNDFAALNADKLDSLTSATYKQGDSAIAAANHTKALNDELSKTNSLTAEQKKNAADLIAANEKQVKTLDERLKATKAQAVAGEAENNAKKASIEQIETERRALQGQNEALQKTLDSKSKANTVAKPDDKAREKQAKDEGEELKQQRQDQKTREDAAFADAQREKQEKEQERITAADREYQKAKEGRAEAFQDKQAAIDRQYQKAKEDRAAAFQDQQAAIDKQNQAEKQQREAEFADAQRKIEDDRKEAQRQRGEAQSQAQGDAGRLLTGEVARGKDLRKLREDQFQRDSVGKLTDEDLLGKDGKALSPQELAALAKRTAGLGPGQLQGKDSEEAAQNALKLITDRQNKALKEQERKEDEAAAKKKREDEQKFKLAQEKIDAQKELDKKKREKAEKDAVEKEDERKAKLKKEAERKEKEKEEGLDFAHNEAKKKDAQKFAKDLRDDERTFKDQQRKDDLENAKKIKDIIESAKVKAPDPSTPPKNVGSNPIADANYVPTPRFLGGPVAPGVTYLGGERGPERLSFGDGQDTVVGQRGPQLFRVQRSGYVHPNNSPFTQSYLNVVQASFSGQQRSPSVSGQPGTAVIASDPAIVQELVRLRQQVEAMRPINQSYQIETRNPMDEVYRATKMAARLRR